MKNIVENQGIKNDKPLALTYEQLKQQLDAREREVMALVAENSALKKSEIEFNEHCRSECENEGSEWVDDFTETPATDAALAEVRAKAIEAFAAQQEEKFKAAALIGATHLESAHEFAALQARAFAVDLREGRV
ncbi:hypothetical protein [Serratia fonticola]|uniref:hypothetical protein n=1 Tax=Serratia fonticola TaxID=47917 RepID=UPI003AAB82D3|nr:hypothetical protein [Serratia fonticola]